MNLLEVFVHPGCISEKSALTLARELQAVWPALEVRIRSFPGASERARTLGVIVAPAFVLNGTIIAVGVPRKGWLVAKLQEFGIKVGGLPLHG
jgi:hypothetical protein